MGDIVEPGIEVLFDIERIPQAHISNYLSRLSTFPKLAAKNVTNADGSLVHGIASDEIDYSSAAASEAAAGAYSS